ncbi:rhomboid family intramembrane serine protease [Maritalea sp.]|uniref:rhomboid family intramembrane serine protease n=1 Tax=Maritalea sp. TaxID=2003361 RepID=UPI003EF1351E
MFIPLYDQNPKIYVERPWVNQSLIIINLIIFAIQYVLPASGEGFVLVTMAVVPGWLSDPLIDQVPYLPDQTTLITYAFLHADWMHVLTNMLFLMVFGDNIEDAMGHVRYLVFYLACAAAGGLAHMLADPTSTAPLVGASGAVAGVIGAYIILFPKVRVYVLARIIIPLPLPIPALWVLGLWIAMQFFFVLFPDGSLTAWWAHLGGLMAGATLVFFLKRSTVSLFGR